MEGRFNKYLIYSYRDEQSETLVKVSKHRGLDIYTNVQYSYNSYTNGKLTHSRSYEYRVAKQDIATVTNTLRTRGFKMIWNYCGLR